MPALRIRRARDTAGLAQALEVSVDGRRRSDVRRGRSVTIPVDPGPVPS